MSTQLKLRRGTTAQHSTFTGAEGEVTVDTTKDTLVVHDGTTAGGVPLLNDVASSVATSNLEDASVTTVKILDANVTSAKLAAAAATGTKLGTDVVVTSGAQTIAGVKTFSSSPVLPGNATTALQAIPKQQLDAFTPAALSTASGSAPSYSCRAWVNFNGTGTVAIRASGNVSSITDNGLGDYTVNFTTAMPDANYSVNVNTSMVTLNSSFGAVQVFSSAANNNVAPTTSAFRFIAVHTANLVSQDSAYLTVSVFR